VFLFIEKKKPTSGKRKAKKKKKKRLTAALLYLEPGITNATTYPFAVSVADRAEAEASEAEEERGGICVTTGLVIAIFSPVPPPIALPSRKRGSLSAAAFWSPSPSPPPPPMLRPKM